MANGRAEVMRHGICECLQFRINGLKLAGSVSKFLVERANFLFSTVPLGNVIVRFKNRGGLSLLVSTQRPATRHYHPGSVGLCLLEFSVPAAGAQQLCANFITRYRKVCLQELVSMLSDRFLGRPSLQLPSPPIPVRDDVIHITDKNGVMSEIEQAGLLGSFRYLPP